MFVELQSPEDVVELSNKLGRRYSEFVGDTTSQRITTDNFDLATQKFPVVVFVDESECSIIYFPTKIIPLEEL